MARSKKNLRESQKESNKKSKNLKCSKDKRKSSNHLSFEKNKKQKLTNCNNEKQSDLPKNIYVCGKCEKIMKMGEQAMCCEICETWFHLACIKMIPDLYRLIKKQAADVRGLLWLCNNCKPKFDSYIQNNYMKGKDNVSIPTSTSEPKNEIVEDSSGKGYDDNDILSFEKELEAILSESRKNILEEEKKQRLDLLSDNSPTKNDCNIFNSPKKKNNLSYNKKTLNFKNKNELLDNEVSPLPFGEQIRKHNMCHNEEKSQININGSINDILKPTQSQKNNNVNQNVVPINIQHVINQENGNTYVSLIN